AGGGQDFSETNIQVGGVDESDIVKTDGKYLYYFNETENAVFVAETSSAGFFTETETKIIKKINIPESFYNVELYVSDNRLTVVAGGYSNTDYSARGYYINRNAKTYTIVFDTSDIQDPELIKFYSSDGDFTKSRRIGDYVYVLSQNYFNYPYWDIQDIDDIEVDAELMLPKKLDISKTSVGTQQNLTIEGKTLGYNATRGDIADCSDISYSFPDEETIKNSGFNPGYNIISAVNIIDTTKSVTTKVIAGSNSEIYMSQDNLYMTEGIYEPNNFRCPINAICAMPFFWGGTQNTLIHKLNIDKDSVSYQDTGLVPGAPLNQYSMDEFEGKFRIITSQWQPERSTGLYILDENLEKISDLTNLAPGETFQSSRFMGDKLFLVTFEQIDPLFAIDLSDTDAPTVLGELKIPGFSTYLHPYDENHLLGLGYDTTINQWGGTQTSGVKLDLYKINYDKKCGDSGLTDVQNKKCVNGDYKGIIVEQLFTKTLGGKGSYSEALNNPRMFVWNKNRNTLLLPATLYERDDDYRTTDYYDGLFALTVDLDDGIELTGQATHIDLSGVEEERTAECSEYTGNTTEPVCREMLNGEVRCESSERNEYVPNYCYKDSDVWQYIGDNSWKYRNMQMKRALYIGDQVYGISDSKIGTYDWSLDEKSTTEFTK
ncbi:beta-propeller domain-containing protein, partial [Candidatus Gracilibacteria bacterium]|nr:beta-propeller domain-containing protein [Candidatus Gracilibacteria bacterium]